MFENLKVGDKVFWRGNTSIGIETVTKITNKQIVTERGSIAKFTSRYWRKNGEAVGNGSSVYSIDRIEPLTSKNIERLEIALLAKKARILVARLVVPENKAELTKFIDQLLPLFKDNKNGQES